MVKANQTWACYFVDSAMLYRKACRGRAFTADGKIVNCGHLRSQNVDRERRVMEVTFSGRRMAGE